MSIQQTNVSFDEMASASLIRISDAADIFKKKVSKNDRPYDRIVLTRNNEIVDRWHKEVLKNICDKNSSIPAGRVTDCLRYFLEGIECEQSERFKKYLPSFSEEQIKFWINFFLNSEIEIIHSAGVNCVTQGFSVIVSGIKQYLMQRKIELVYSKSSNPVEWDRLSNENPSVMHGRDLPYGLTQDSFSEIEEKVRAVIKNSISSR